MNDGFYNSTAEHGQQLRRFERQAESQEAVILRFFKAHPGRLYTPSQIGQLLPQAPIHSIRARITTLEKRGLIVKTTCKRMGEYGRPEHAWTYPKDGGGRATVGGDLLL